MYVAICANNRGFIGGVPSHFAKGGGAEVCIDMTVIVAGLVAETDQNEVAPSLRRSAGGTDASVRSVPLWGPLFDFTEKYGLGLLLVLAMLKSMWPVTEML